MTRGVKTYRKNTRKDNGIKTSRWHLSYAHPAAQPNTRDEIGRVGKWLENIPEGLTQELQLRHITNRHWFWLAEGDDTYYKLAHRSSQGASRVRWEGSILAGLRHPSIPGGGLNQTEEWEIARIETVTGHPLSRIREQLSPEEKYTILSDIEAALRYINSQALIHADVGPDNILWDGKHAHIIDFEESIKLRSPLKHEDSPDFIGGPPCCYGYKGYGYATSHCMDSLRRWLLSKEYGALKEELLDTAAWDPRSIGNKCDPWTAPSDGSIYQSLTLGSDYVPGQRDPALRVRYLAARGDVSFEGKRVLDIGCNLGRLSTFLNTLGISRYVGVDVDARFIRLARKLSSLEGVANTTFQSGDITDPDVAKALHNICPCGYDIIFCMSVYHHMEHKAAFWDAVDHLGCKWLIFEGPIITTLNRNALLNASWSTEKHFLKSKGYTLLVESTENDYRQRIVALFERHPASQSRIALNAQEGRGIPRVKC